MKDSSLIVELKKSREQIRAFISTVKARTGPDELLIEEYCSEIGVKVEFIQRKEKVSGITFEEFVEWLNRPLPHRGDVIFLDDQKLVCIVKSIGVTKITITATLTQDGQLSIEDRDIPFCSYRNANRDELKRLQSELYKKGLAWTNYTYNLTRRYVPKENEQIRISLLGKKTGLGVFREINEKGQAVMYCVKMTDAPVRYHLYETIGHISEFQFERISVPDRKLLAYELECNNLIWNGHAKRIEPLGYRMDNGGLYNFINDYFEIICTHDYYKPKDTNRINAGNYFRIYNEAVDMINNIYAKLVCRKNPRAGQGEPYYYINTNFGITRTQDNYKPKDLKRFKQKNYFIGNTDAIELLNHICEYRKIQFYSFSGVIPKKKKARRKKP